MSIIAHTRDPEPYFGPSPRTRATVALVTPDGVTDLHGSFCGIELRDDPEFHLLEVIYSTGEIEYGTLPVGVDAYNPGHPVLAAKIGDEWSAVLDGHRTPTYRYMGLHEIVNVWIDQQTLDRKRIIAPVESAEVGAL